MARVNNSYYAILGILSIGQMSGYQIKTWVDNAIGYFWDIDYKQIYPTLKSFVDSGLATFEVVKTGNRPESKVYQLTEPGLMELKDWLVKPLPEGKQSANELLLKLFFGNLIPVEVNLEHLDRYKAIKLEALQNIEKIKDCFENKPNKDDFWYYRMTTINKGYILFKSEVDWCNEAMEYLKSNINS